MSWQAKLVFDVAGKVFFWDQRAVLTPAGCGVDSWGRMACRRQKTRIPGLCDIVYAVSGCKSPEYYA